MKRRALLAFVLIALVAGMAVAAALTITISPGDSLLVSCLNALTGQSVATAQFSVSCAANTPTPTPPALAPVDPAILGTCPASAHDRYVTTGPDGKLYRTWHPQTVLIDVNNPTLGSCTFAHEHGDDPALSVANAAAPAFGYIGDLAGFPEPHEGFKVYVLNAGYVVDDGGVVQVNTRAVVHMGTGGVGRFDTRYHSLSFDLTSSNGHFVHLQGMADTGGVGAICASPRAGKTALTLPGTGCDVRSLYEIWNMTLTIADGSGRGAQATFAPSAFDPITILNPAEIPGQRTTYYTNNYFTGGPFFGCRREGYAGPVYWHNTGGATTYFTDAFGAIGKGAVVQQMSASGDLGIRMTSSNFYQAKESASYCAPGLGLKN